MIYGETIYIYKASRICDVLMGALFYIIFMDSFREIFKAIFLRDISLIPKFMSLGIGDLILVLGYLCIPKLISIVTRNYFEDPVRCKKAKRLIYYVVWFITIMAYSLIKDLLTDYVIVISFTSIVLILLYSIIINVAVWLLTEGLYKQDSEENKLDKKHKYLNVLSKQYSIYKERCEKRNKSTLDWEKFIRILMDWGLFS
ncbi:MAG: hypothetical protein Q8936_02920 [Bacillota bacterium]|nr:hypothetical protein [Bacillota bacterium]